MSFLDEGTFVGKNAVADALKDPEFKALKSDEKAKAIATLKQGGSITTEKKGKDMDGDGDIDSKDYLAARDAAIKKAKAKIKEMTSKGYSRDPETGEIIPMSSDDAIQSFLNKIKQDLENEDNLDEIKTKGIEKFLRGKSYKTPYSDFIDSISSKDNYDSDIDSNDIKKSVSKLTKLKKGELSEDEFKAFIKELRKNGYDNDEIEKLKKSYNDAVKAQKEKMKEEKTVELPADTTFTLDLKHLMKKHMDEGKSKEDTIKLTKVLMKKLHDKGEVTVKGTKVIFKENKTNEASIMGVPLESFADYYTALDLAKNIGVPVVAFSALLAIMGVQKATEFLKRGKEAVMAWYEQNKLREQEDAQLALPEPDAPDYLGDDGMDYEGGMAKSQMLKMKKYAAAICDMIDDESQLEAWVQAKLTKASDYMSAVYHYLDYQNSKMNNE